MSQQQTLKNYMNLETLYIDTNILFGYIKSLVNITRSKGKPLHKNYLTIYLPKHTLNNLNKTYVLFITDIVEKEVIINLMLPKHKKLGGGCALSLKDAKRIFSFIFNQFGFIKPEKGILATFRFSKKFLKFCYKYKLPLLDAIHVITALKLRINMATWDKKIYREIPPITICSPLKILGIKS